MLDFRPKKPTANPIFTLNKAEQIRMAGRTRRSKRGWWHTVFLILVGGAIVWLAVEWMRHTTPLATAKANREVTAPPMARPTLEGMQAMPTAADINGEADAVKDAVDKGLPPVWNGDNDPRLLAWARGVIERDQAKPPLPEAIETKDLVLRHARIGSPLLVSGQLIDRADAPLSDGGPGWQRMLIMPEPDQYLLLLAPASDTPFTIGNDLQVVGRYVGLLHLPVPRPADAKATPASVELPLILARRVHPTGIVDGSDRPFWRSEGMFTIPNDLYAQVDDERLVLETRAYYYTLGQMARELATPEELTDAPNANQKANDIHQDPAAFRGKPFRVRGKVFNAWVDQQVARDKPFGVERVVRIIFWSEDWSPISVNEGGTSKIVHKSVTRVFEIAAITDQPPPAVGTSIETAGRFLRLRALEVKPDRRREESSLFHRQSDRSYTFLFVTNGWTELPPEAPSWTWTWINTVILGFILVGTVWLLWRVRRHAQREGWIQESVRKLRANRHRWKNAPAANTTPDGDTATKADTPPPTP